MLDTELDPHAERSALLDGERGGLQLLQSTGLLKVDHDIGAVLDDQGKLEDDDLDDRSVRLRNAGSGSSRRSAAYRALVTRLSDRAGSRGGTNSKRRLPASERLILRICAVGTRNVSGGSFRDG
jgi:hypothetical protein